MKEKMFQMSETVRNVRTASEGKHFAAETVFSAHATFAK